MFQFLDSRFGLFHPVRAFELERFGYYADGQNGFFPGCPGDHRRAAGASAATHAGGDEGHVDTVQLGDDFINGFFGSTSADFRL